MMIYVSDSPMGRNIRCLRRKKKISRHKLAQITGIPYLTLYCLENRTLVDIDYDHLKNLCTALCVSVEELVEKEFNL
ncbi:MAG: helix-turn-helix transcriptional regulator [Oscillospiraceae bacterium]|nr:helix-turn-helix transcriptional regulator [Oscillospiraceae bacterium]